MIGREHHRIGMAAERMPLHGSLQLFAKLGHEVGKLNEADPGPAPKMIMNLSDRVNPRARHLRKLP